MLYKSAMLEMYCSVRGNLVMLVCWPWADSAGQQVSVQNDLLQENSGPQVFFSHESVPSDKTFIF